MYISVVITNGVFFQEHNNSHCYSSGDGLKKKQKSNIRYCLVSTAVAASARDPCFTRLICTLFLFVTKVQ